MFIHNIFRFCKESVDGDLICQSLFSALNYYGVEKRRENVLNANVIYDPVSPTTFCGSALYLKLCFNGTTYTITELADLLD